MGNRRRSLVVLAFATAAAAVVAAAIAAPPLPLWQRLWLGGEYPGFTPQAQVPTMAGQVNSAKTAAAFFSAPFARVRAEFRKDGVRVGIGEDLAGPTKSKQAYSAVIQTSSNAAATRLVAYFGQLSLLPCPESCTVQPISLKVSGIPGAIGTERIRRVADGPKPAQQPFEIDFVFFADGPFTYVMLSNGPPNAVDHHAFFDGVKRLFERVKGSPPVARS